MLTLGIESTAHTLGIGIVENGEILADQRAMYEPEQGGIEPGKAAKHHVSHALQTLNNAVQDADITEDEFELVGFAQGPGMHPCLDVGGVIARSLAVKHDLPLIGVNHAAAHLEIAREQTPATDPVYLYVSGGNSQVIAFTQGRYRIFGETLDIAIGNALDKFARTLGIPHPGGPRIEELAEHGENLVELPYVVKGMDFSFSGIVTELQRKWNNTDVSKEDLCYSFQEYAFAMLTEAVERAVAHTGKEEVVVTGGVAANKRLQAMLETMMEERGGAAYTCPREYAGDNGAMIAFTAEQWHEQHGWETGLDEPIKPGWRVDQIQF